MLGTLAAMFYSWLFAFIEPEIDGIVLAGMAFVALFIASFWMHAFVGLVLGLACAVIFNGRAWCAVGTVSTVVLGTWLLLGSLRVGLFPRDAAGPRITVFSANLMYGEGDGDSLLEQIAAVDPDVVVLQEYTSSFAQRWEDQLRSRYPYAVLIPSEGAFGQATFSRLEFIETPRRYPRTEISPSRGWPAQTEVVVRVGESDVSVVNVHLLPPTGLTMVVDQHRMASGLADAFGHGERPTVLAGDFNSNERGLPVKRVLREGFKSVFSVRGTGLGATWPRTGVLRHVPGTRLDHVLYRGERFRLLEQGVGADFGSDHRPVWATILVNQ